MKENIELCVGTKIGQKSDKRAIKSFNYLKKLLVESYAPIYLTKKKFIKKYADEGGLKKELKEGFYPYFSSVEGYMGIKAAFSIRNQVNKCLKNVLELENGYPVIKPEVALNFLSTNQQWAENNWIFDALEDFYHKNRNKSLTDLLKPVKELQMQFQVAEVLAEE